MTLGEIDIKGKVTDENGLPVPFASVTIKESKWSTSADSAGNFSISKVVFLEKMTVIASSAGFSETELTFYDVNAISQKLNIRLLPVLMEEVVVQSYTYDQRSIMMGGISLGQKIDRVNKDEISILTEPEQKGSAINVFPNPVLAGNTININCGNLAEADYNLQLINAAGQPVQTKRISKTNQSSIALEIGSIPAGTYLVVMVEAKTGKKFTSKVLVN
jgi:hypothetical protein